MATFEDTVQADIQPHWHPDSSDGSKVPYETDVRTQADAAAGTLQSPAADAAPTSAGVLPDSATTIANPFAALGSWVGLKPAAQEEADAGAPALTSPGYPAVSDTAGAGAEAEADTPTNAATDEATESTTPVSQLLRRYSSQSQDQTAQPLTQVPSRRTSSTAVSSAWEAAAAAATSNGDTDLSSGGGAGFSSGGGAAPTSNGGKAAEPEVVDAGSSLKAEEDIPAVNVRELRDQLSATRVPLTAKMAPPPKPASPQPKPEPSMPVSEHDKVNTVNAAALLATGEFKKLPGQDVIPYDELVTLRLEDGIDVTRKEEYLSGDEFTRVFGCDRDAYAKLPQWKRLQIKRNVKLF